MKGNTQKGFRPQSEGDVNLSPHRAEWQATNIDAETRALLDEDARYFLHQYSHSIETRRFLFCQPMQLIEPVFFGPSFGT